MKGAGGGPPRRVTDMNVYKILAWRNFKDLCDDIGVSVRMGRKIRQGYRFKKPCPEKSK